MGRGVSTPSEAEVIVFGYVESGDDNPYWHEELVMDVRDSLKSIYKSLTNCKEWLGNENLAVLENRLVYIGVSEYYGCLAYWIVPKEDNLELGKRWAHQIEPTFEKYFGTIRKLGTFSNGEQVFERIKKEQK